MLNTDFLAKLCNADAIASNEFEVRDIIINEIKNLDIDYHIDGLGSLIIHKKCRVQNENNYKIMISAHMDEIGFMVKAIHTNGFIEIIPIGGISYDHLSNTRVRITNWAGEKFSGVTHIKGNKDEYTLFVDLCVDNYDDIKNLGIDIGQMVTFDSIYKEDSDICISKAIDDRAGCFVLIESLKKLSDIELDMDVYFVASSSEEVGLRGIKTATSFIQPDIAIAIDIVSEKNPMDTSILNTRRINKGTIITHYSKNAIPSPIVLNYFKKLANKFSIPTQNDIMKNGGTDFDAVQTFKEGLFGLNMNLPVRYAHTPNTIISKNDIQSTINLVVKYLETMNKETLEKWRKFDRRDLL